MHCRTMHTLIHIILAYGALTKAFAGNDVEGSECPDRSACNYDWRFHIQIEHDHHSLHLHKCIYPEKPFDCCPDNSACNYNPLATGELLHDQCLYWDSDQEKCNLYGRTTEKPLPVLAHHTSVADVVEDSVGEQANEESSKIFESVTNDEKPATEDVQLEEAGFVAPIAEGVEENDGGTVKEAGVTKFGEDKEKLMIEESHFQEDDIVLPETSERVEENIHEMEANAIEHVIQPELLTDESTQAPKKNTTLPRASNAEYSSEAVEVETIIKGTTQTQTTIPTDDKATQESGPPASLKVNVGEVTQNREDKQSAEKPFIKKFGDNANGEYEGDLEQAAIEALREAAELAAAGA